MHLDTSSSFFKMCEWLYRLALLNILCIGFTIMGGIIFGFFPAISAMFRLNEKWLKGEDFPIVKEYWQAYRKHFIKSNGIGICMVLTCVALFIDFALVRNFSGILYYIILSSSVTVLVLSFIVMLYVFSLLSTFPNTGIVRLIRRSIQISTLFPIQTWWMTLSIVSFLFICWVIPGIALLFLGSGISYIALYFSQFALRRLEKHKTIAVNMSIKEKRGAVHG